MSAIASRTLAILACCSLVACGGSGGDGEQSGANGGGAKRPDPATGGVEPVSPEGSGGIVVADDVAACLDEAGLDADGLGMEEIGLAGTPGEYFKVALGEGDFDDPSQPGSFELFGHLIVFESDQVARSVEDALNDIFASGELSGNAYVGFNTDAAPDTSEGNAFQDCASGG